MSETDEKKQVEVGPITEGDDAGKVGVKLAHPLSKSGLRRLYLPEDTPANVHDVIAVNPEQAMSLIAAGMVQVNPSDTEGVNEIIKGAGASALGVEPSSTSGNTNPDVVSGAGPGYADLKGDDLKEALKTRGLPQSGSADDQRKAVAEYDAANPPQV